MVIYSLGGRQFFWNLTSSGTLGLLPPGVSMNLLDGEIMRLATAVTECGAESRLLRPIVDEVNRQLRVYQEGISPGNTEGWCCESDITCDVIQEQPDLIIITFGDRSVTARKGSLRRATFAVLDNQQESRHEFLLELDLMPFVNLFGDKLTLLSVGDSCGTSGGVDAWLGSEELRVGFNFGLFS